MTSDHFHCKHNLDKEIDLSVERLKGLIKRLEAYQAKLKTSENLEEDLETMEKIVEEIATHNLRVTTYTSHLLDLAFVAGKQDSS